MVVWHIWVIFVWHFPWMIPIDHSQTWCFPGVLCSKPPAATWFGDEVWGARNQWIPPLRMVPVSPIITNPSGIRPSWQRWKTSTGCAATAMATGSPEVHLLRHRLWTSPWAPKFWCPKRSGYLQIRAPASFFWGGLQGGLQKPSRNQRWPENCPFYPSLVMIYSF